MTDAWGYSDCCFPFDNGDYLYAYLSRLIWILPAIYLMIRYDKNWYLNKRFVQPCFNKSSIIVLMISSLYVIGVMLINHKGFWFNRDINLPLEVIKYAIVGLVEETVFRGWGYNALSKVTSDRKAVILSTVFFVSVHWPAYFIKLYRFGIFDFSGMLMQSLSAFVCGIIFCWLAKKEKNIWNPIIAHTFYDLAFVSLIG